VIVTPAHSLVRSDLQTVHLSNCILGILEPEVFKLDVAPEFRVEFTRLEELVAL